MIVLSHRGYWLRPEEKNTPPAFSRSFDMGFGTETDVRDTGGRLVISHDLAGGDEISFSEVLDMLADRPLPLALNIKADGLARALVQELAARSLSHWFTFDMSVPELVAQLRLGLPVFTRASEYEPEPALYARATGVWLDSFERDWFGVDAISEFLSDGKQVCVVSPELHGRDPQPLWTLLKNSRFAEHPQLMICTDRPEDARAQFGGRR